MIYNLTHSCQRIQDQAFKFKAKSAQHSTGVIHCAKLGNAHLWVLSKHHIYDKAYGCYNQFILFD